MIIFNFFFLLSRVKTPLSFYTIFTLYFLEKQMRSMMEGVLVRQIEETIGYNGLRNKNMTFGKI